MNFFSYFFYVTDKYFTFLYYLCVKKNFLRRYIFLSAGPRSLTICDHDMPQTRDSELKKFSV